MTNDDASSKSDDLKIEIIGGEAEAECWKIMFRNLIDFGWMEEEITFNIISCSNKIDGARIFFHHRLKDLIKTYFTKENTFTEYIFFDKKGVLIKMDYAKGLAHISYLISLILTDLREASTIAKGGKDEISKKKYLRENINLLLCCSSSKLRRGRGGITAKISYKKDERRYYVNIKIRLSRRNREIQTITISDRYPKRIISKVSKIFFPDK